MPDVETPQTPTTTPPSSPPSPAPTPAPTPAPPPVETPPPAAAAEPAPASYDFSKLALPDTIKDDPVAGQVRELATTHKLSLEAAQAVADTLAAHQAARDEAWNGLVEAKMAEWRQTIATDPEIGGEPGIAKAKEILASHGSPELRTWLEETGAGMFPGLVKFLVKVGKELGESPMLRSAGHPGVSKEEAHRLMYNHPTSQQMFS